jgi:hypothetical protein
VVGEEHREEASEIPDGDVVAGLLRQHADVTEAMDRVRNARGEDRALPTLTCSPVRFSAFKKAVADHAEKEEHEEFPP